MPAKTVLSLLFCLALLVSACGDGGTADESAPSDQRDDTGLDREDYSGPFAIDEAPESMPGQLRLERLATLAESLEAVGVVAHPAIDGGLLVVDRRGHVFEVVDGELREEPWIDLVERIESESNFERGLLGLDHNGDYAYLYYTDLAGDSNVVSFELGAGGRPVLETERQVLFVEQPGVTHNAGSIRLDDDGNLWVPLGDGGGGGPRWNAQDPDNLLGSILRITPTPDASEPYRVPEDNPFVSGDPGMPPPEVFVYGLRNPWGFWFDTATGDLWIPDVGEAAYEEINLVRIEDAGANLGWPWFEGYEPLEDGADRDESPPDDLHEPLLAYHHSALGCAVIGGAVVRDGPSRLEGAYLFGDLCSRYVVGIWPDDHDGDQVALAARLESELTSLTVIDGEIYATTRKPGAVFRLTPGVAS